MAVRNLLTGEVLLRNSNGLAGDAPAGVQLAIPYHAKPGTQPVLSYVRRNWKKPVSVPIPIEASRFWTVIRASDADMKLIREAGYAITDGRERP